MMVEIRYTSGCMYKPTAAGPWYSCGGDIITTVDAPSLVGVDLSFRFLDHADLHGADMRSINLERSQLVGADLGSSDLTSARLAGAELGGANLRNAVLVGSDLRGAHLEWACLHGADLSGASLESATIRGAYCDVQTVWPSGKTAPDLGVIIGEPLRRRLARAPDPPLRGGPSRQGLIDAVERAMRMRR